MFCENCGAKIPDSVSYCDQCGTPVPPTQVRPAYHDGSHKSPMLWIVGGIAGCAVIVAVTVAVLFAAGALAERGSAEEVSRVKNENTQVLKDTQQPAATPMEEETSVPKPTVLYNSAEQTENDEGAGITDDEKTEPASKTRTNSVESVVKHAREIYYGTNERLKSYSLNKIAGEYEDYYDDKKHVLRKAVTYPTSSGDGYIKHYTAEYYYDDAQKLVFAFAYKKAKGKVKEYRAYYGTDGKLYRYINEKGKVTDYKKGVEVPAPSSKLKYELYNKGTYYLHLALE